MKRKKKRLIILITGIAAALLLFGGVFVFAANRDDKNGQQTSSSNPVSEESQNNENLPRQGEVSPSTDSSNNTSNAPAKPTLNKSSGNNGPIPIGVLVNFICNAQAGTSCKVILTSSTNSANVIDLGAKQVESSYGQTPFASWDWTSLAGQWNVVARATNSGGSTDSNTQTLKVQ